MTTPLSPAAADRNALRLVVAVCLILIAGQLLAAPRSDIAVIFAGPDSYMHLLRLEAWIGSGVPPDDRIARIAAPHGGVLHWTKLFDFILWLPAWFLSHFTTTSGAVAWAGYLTPGAIMIGVGLASFWAFRPLDDGGYRGLFACAVVMSPAIFHNLSLGRVDHHGFMLMIFILLCGCALRMILEPQGRRLHFLIGVAASMGIWAGSELVMAIVPIFAVLTMAWIHQDRFAAPPHSWMLCGRDIAFASKLSIAVIILVDPPGASFFDLFYDRLSIVHAAFMLGCLGFWSITGLVERKGFFSHSTSGRLVWCVGYGLAAASVMLFFFPEAPRGFSAGIDPRIVPIWQNQVIEMAPTLSWNAEGLAKLFSIALPMIPASLLLLRESLALSSARRRGRTLESRDLLTIYLAISAALVFPLALLHARMSGYGIFLSIAILLTLWNRVQPRIAALRPWPQNAARLAAMALLFHGLAFGIPAHRLLLDDDVARGGQGDDRCDLRRIAETLNAVETTPTTIIVSLNHATELLYRTPHSVVAAPYHRNADAIFDNHAILHGDDPQRAEAAFRSRGGELALICNESGGGDDAFSAAAQNANLHARLSSSQPPPWLKPEPLPATAPPGWRLYRLEPKAQGEFRAR